MKPEERPAGGAPGEKEKQGGSLGEMLRFALTGGICFLVEFACLVALKGGLGMDTLLATPIAFLVSVIVNYLMCVRWVWPDAKGKGNTARMGFLVTSVIGLFLNEGLMLLFRVLLGEEQVLFTLAGKGFSMYMLNKILATLLVMIWNFVTKKAILQSDFMVRLTKRRL